MVTSSGGEAIISEARWRDHPMLGAAAISINISPRCINREFLIDRLLPMVAGSDMDPTKLILEITESTAIENRIEAIELLRQVDELGVGLALDDFGVGFSSFGELLDLPLQLLKVDKSLVESTRKPTL